MRRNARIGSVIGSVIFLVAGISTIGKAGGSEVAKSQLITSVSTEQITQETEKPTTAEQEEPKYQSIIYSCDFDAEDAELLVKIAMVEAGNRYTEGKALVMLFESKSDSTWHERNLKFLFKHQDHYFYTEKEQADEED
jgi:hypothetical protein